MRDGAFRIWQATLVSGKTMKVEVVGRSSSRLWPRWLLAMCAGFVALASVAGSVTYEYDQLGRLRKAIYPDGTVIVYSLDPAGNRTSVATGKDSPAPTIPTNLAGTPSPTPTVVLTWTASTDTGGVGLGGYRIYRNGSQVADSAGTATTFADTTATGLV